MEITLSVEPSEMKIALKKVRDAHSAYLNSVQLILNQYSTDAKDHDRSPEHRIFVGSFLGVGDEMHGSVYFSSESSGALDRDAG